REGRLQRHRRARRRVLAQGRPRRACRADRGRRRIGLRRVRGAGSRGGARVPEAAAVRVLDEALNAVARRVPPSAQLESSIEAASASRPAIPSFEWGEAAYPERGAPASAVKGAQTLQHQIRATRRSERRVDPRRVRQRTNAFAACRRRREEIQSTCLEEREAQLLPPDVVVALVVVVIPVVGAAALWLSIAQSASTAPRRNSLQR